VRPTERDRIRELIARYDRPGPRYTSYPTAVEFSEEVGPAEYEARLEEANGRSEAPLSLYLHLPFCEHRCLFCGCHVIVTPHHEQAGPYLDLLAREIRLVAEKLPSRRGFAQLHLGGGTPTYSAPSELRSLLRELLRHFEVLPGAELAIEVDPRVTSSEHLDMLAEVGFNRISMGVQDFNPVVQERVHRIQTPEQTRALIDHARVRGFSGINVDLIYGLPLQTPQGFEATLDRVIEMDVDRVAAYSFAYVPWLQGHQRKLERDDLPDSTAKMELFAIARERLLGEGYEPIGMDHFAKPDDELALARRDGRLRRNFQGYTVVAADDVVAFGISGIGDVAGAIVQNEKKLSRYREAIDQDRLPTARGIVRNRDDALRADVIQRLMCNFVVDIPSVERKWGIEFESYFRPDLERLAPYGEEGLVEISESAILATSVGELFVRNLAMSFDRYMREKHETGEKNIFSRTV
jgi:oxygen-independent coproporphyrinogen-3 oxidase